MGGLRLDDHGLDFRLIDIELISLMQSEIAIILRSGEDPYVFTQIIHDFNGVERYWNVLPGGGNE